MSNIKIVIVENPYDVYQESQEARDVLSSIWKVKLDGYKMFHKYGALPMGATDWFSNHIAICVEQKGHYDPFIVFKSTTYNQCKSFGEAFPVVPHNFKGVEDIYKDHVTAINSWVFRKKSQGDTVAYNSGYTVNPVHKDSQELKKAIKELSMVIFYQYYTHYNVKSVIAAAACKFKIERMKEFVGFNYLSLNGQKLPTFKAKVFNDDPYNIMHIDDGFFTDEIKEMSRAYKNIWNNRLTIRSKVREIKKAA